MAANIQSLVLSKFNKFIIQFETVFENDFSINPKLFKRRPE